MSRLRAVLGYCGASVGLLAAVLTPFLLLRVFTTAVAGTGIQVAPVYTGGRLARTIDKGNYRILVNEPVRMPNRLVRGNDFVQIAWTPAAALPARIADEIDVDGDSKPDLMASFEPAPGQQAGLRVKVEALSDLASPFESTGAASMTGLIVHAGDRIILRTPLRTPSR